MLLWSLSLTILFVSFHITAFRNYRSRKFHAALLFQNYRCSLKVYCNSDISDETESNTNPVANSFKSLYEKVFFYGLDKSLNLQDRDRSKVKRISSELYQHEKPNPFFTKSEQIASAFIKEKNSPRKNKNRPNNRTEDRQTPSLDDNISILRQRLSSLENQIKVIEISELSLEDDVHNQEIVELLKEKKALQSEINSIKADIITQLAIVDND